jgi:butyryl-CoA dehydrogenase
VTAELRDFAESVAAAADRTLLPPPPWRPGTAQDERSPALAAALDALGWSDLAADAALAPMAGAAGLELGRRLAPLDAIDALLGGSPLAGGLVRHGGAGSLAVTAGLELRRITDAEAVPYGDALGVHRVLASEPAGRRDGAALRAWTAASVGYLAGLGQWAVGEAVTYTRERRAFGSVLASLDPVQQRLADAATATRGIALLAEDGAGAAALAWAGPAAVGVTAACQQVVGAIGFTLEFPLQRAYRRARALALWNDAMLA